MARLFSIEVPYENEHYSALVTLKEKGADICCVVRYIDKRVRHILSGDLLVFSLDQGLKEPKNLPTELAENFVNCTTNAISNYISHTP